MASVVQPNYIRDELNYALLSGYAIDILANDTITSGSFSNYFQVVGVRQVDLLISVLGTVSGTNPTLQFFISVDQFETPSGVNITTPSVGFVTSINQYNGAILSTGNTTTDYISIHDNVIGDFLRVHWTVSGTNPSFGRVYARLVIKK